MLCIMQTNELSVQTERKLKISRIHVFSVYIFVEILRQPRQSEFLHILLLFIFILFILL